MQLSRAIGLSVCDAVALARRGGDAPILSLELALTGCRQAADRNRGALARVSVADLAKG
jgi:hypothetical protein